MATIEIRQDYYCDGCPMQHEDEGYAFCCLGFMEEKMRHPSPSCSGTGTYRLVPVDAAVLDAAKCTPEAVMGWLRENPELYLSPTNLVMAFLSHAGVKTTPEGM